MVLKKYLISIFLLAFLSGTTLAQSKRNFPARELTYKVSIEILSDTLNEYVRDYLHQKYGDSVVCTYDTRGNIRMDHYGGGENSTEHTLFDASKSTIYAKFSNSDTIYFYSTLLNEFAVDSIQRETSETGLELTYVSRSLETGDLITQRYSFAKDSLEVNPLLYKMYNDLSFSEIILESGALPINLAIETTIRRLTRRLIRVRTIKNPKKSFFLPDSRIPLVEIWAE